MDGLASPRILTPPPSTRNRLPGTDITALQTVDQILNSYANEQPIASHPIVRRVRPNVDYATSLHWLFDVPSTETEILEDFILACHHLAGIDEISSYNAAQREHFAMVYHITRITPFLLRGVLSRDNNHLRFLARSAIDLLMSMLALVTVDEEAREQLQIHN